MMLKPRPITSGAVTAVTGGFKLPFIMDMEIIYK
jgi:hypothetical protein